jgi:hypothetical protein
MSATLQRIPIETGMGTPIVWDKKKRQIILPDDMLRRNLPPPVAPAIDVSQMPVLSRSTPQIAPQVNAGEPPALNIPNTSAARPRVVNNPQLNLVRPLINDVRSQPAETIEAPTVQPSIAPPIPYEQMGVGNRQIIPLSQPDPSVASIRERQIKPPDEITKSVDAISDLRHMPLERRHGVKGKLKDIGEGAWEGFRRGGWPGLITGSIYGGVSSKGMAQLRRDRQIGEEQGTLDEELQNASRQAQVQQAIQRPKIELMNAQTNSVYKKSQADIARMNAETNAAYKREMATLGKQRADDNYELRTQANSLRARGYDLEADALEERIRHNTVSETETGRHNRTSEEIAKDAQKALGDYRGALIDLSTERNAISRTKSRGAQSTVPTGVRTQANKVAEKFEQFKSMAASEPDEAKKAAYLQAAKVQAAVLANQHGDLFEVGEQNGWPYVKPKAQAVPDALPATGAPRRGAQRNNQRSSDPLGLFN